MFFKKKNEELSDQLAAYQQRKSPRHGTPQFDLDAGVCITGLDGEAQLGNISVSGCSIQSVTYANITPNDVYQVKIIPGREDNMKPFDLKLKLSWTKSSETVFIAGFELEDIKDSPKLKNYVDVLHSRGIEPDYGNMKPDNN